jgi:hypothetical protein
MFEQPILAAGDGNAVAEQKRYCCLAKRVLTSKPGVVRREVVTLGPLTTRRRERAQPGAITLTCPRPTARWLRICQGLIASRSHSCLHPFQFLLQNVSLSPEIDKGWFVTDI